MINKIQIEKLFGLYDYDIDLKNDAHVKILTGPNGYGKTTILYIINNLLRGYFWYFYYLVFNVIKVVIDDNNVIIIRKTPMEKESDKDEVISEEFIINFTFYQDKDLVNEFWFDKEYIHDILEKADRYSDDLHRYLDNEDFLSANYKYITDDFIQEKSKNLTLFLQEQNSSFLGSQRIYQNKEVFSNVYSARRYSRIRRRPTSYSIDNVSNDLSGRYTIQQRQFSDDSQQVDSSFIKRLVHADLRSYTEEEFKSKLKELEKLMSEYQKYHIINPMTIENDYGDYKKNKEALSLYVDDMFNKLSSFNDFYQRLSLFDNFINGKELSDKRIELSDKGLRVVNSSGNIIPLHKLSSGEQNLIILYYQLVFYANKHSVLLIDEPENSIHLAWQRNMLNDYLDMAKRLNCQIIIATHSAVFIHSKWELTTDLFEESEKKNNE